MYKLLIVDDEDVEREGMADFIQWEKYGISLAGTAWNGVEGYEEIQNQMPDIVITDIKMPVMNGIELIRKTREDFPDIVFIVLSGYGEYEYTSRAMELGVRHYILKPCDEAKIVEVIGKVTEELKVREEKRGRYADPGQAAGPESQGADVPQCAVEPGRYPEGLRGVSGGLRDFPGRGLSSSVS